MRKLKPCPFHDCNTCGCNDSVDIPDRDWNTRPEEERLLNEIVRLRGVLQEILMTHINSKGLHADTVKMAQLAQEALIGEKNAQFTRTIK